VTGDVPARARTGTTSRGDRAARPVRSIVPSLRTERALLRSGHRLVAGMDEVGRGALAGPVSVGVVLVAESTRSAPGGVRDSKLLSPAAREALAPRLRRWALAWSVGHASPAEIDAHGIVPALRLAGRRALADVPDLPDVVLLDGSHDWLSLPQSAAQTEDHDAVLFELATTVPAGLVRVVDLRTPAPHVDLPGEPAVTTMVKADLRCAAVAAASVLAKVERDALMVSLAAEHPEYGWHENKGYSAPEHLEALRRLGACEKHRRSWNVKACLPGVAP